MHAWPGQEFQNRDQGNTMEAMEVAEEEVKLLLLRNKLTNCTWWWRVIIVNG